MLESKVSQFTLSSAGEILWQEKYGSPLPGQPVAKLARGEHVLRPVIEVIKNDITSRFEPQALQNSLRIWLNTHLSTILEPLMLLGIGEGGEGPVREIAAKVYDGLGVVSRSSVEESTAKLDTEMRAALRQKKIRLGPILIFIPVLNKPAAVRLRALLWCVYHGRNLTEMGLPPDGIVSLAIDTLKADEDFYRSIGYPIYGNRAVRIDMLDRVINAVYDSAERGKFRARHEMAEWLGCSIDNLYAVLEAMGHRRIDEGTVREKDPKDEANLNSITIQEPQADAQQAMSIIPDATSIETSEQTIVPETKISLEEACADVIDDAAKVAPVADKKSEIKPDLALFLLKRGKASDKSQSSGGHKKNFKHRNDQNRVPEVDKFSSVHTKNNPDKAKEWKKSSFDKEDSRKGGKFKDAKKAKKFSKQDEREIRVMRADAKYNEEDSPFAILQKLKVKSSDG